MIKTRLTKKSCFLLPKRRKNEKTFILWCKEFFISSEFTPVTYIQYKLEEFFIRKYRDWMSFPNRFEVKIDIDLGEKL